MTLWKAFLLTFTALLPLINPLGSALVFLGLVGDVSPDVYRTLARKIAINNIIFLAVIELTGSAILNFFGVSLPIVELAGGVVIAAIGWGVLNEKDSSANTRDKAEELGVQTAAQVSELRNKAFYPFTFPVTSGPGTLVAMLTLGAHMSTTTLALNVVSHLGEFIAVVVLSALVYVCYAYAPRITASISPSTAHGILRVVAFILLCIGVQIAWNGLAALLKTVLKA